MDEMIRERMKGAYKNVKLKDDLKSQAEANLLKKAHRAGKLSVSREMLAVAAVLVVFVAVNAVLIGLNVRKGNEVTPVESTANFQKQLLAEFMPDVKPENYLVECEGESLRTNEYVILENIFYEIVVFDAPGVPGNSMFKISALAERGTKTLRCVDICDNKTVVIDGVCYMADVTDAAIADIKSYREGVMWPYLRDGAITDLEYILTIDDVNTLADCPNAYVRFFDDDGERFCVAALCYDAGGVKCTIGEGIAEYVEYGYFWFDEDGEKISEKKNVFGFGSESWETRGVVEFNSEWYEVINNKTGGDAHNYEMVNIMKPEDVSHLSHFSDSEMEYYIRSHTQFFMEQQGSCIVVGDIANADSGKVFDFSQVNTLDDLEELMGAFNVYSKVLSQNQYLVVLPYNKDGVASSFEGQVSELRVGYFVVLENGDMAFTVIPLKGVGNAMESLGVTCCQDRWYLFGKLQTYMQYEVIDLENGDVEILDYDEGVCREILVNNDIDYFAKGVDNYWLLGSEDVIVKEAKDPKTYCSNHGWDEMCTSTLSVRDIYVTPNWIGKSAKEFIELEVFFDDFVMTDFEDGKIFVSEDSSENAYQINMRLEELNFQVSTEPDSDEIIAVTLYGNHNYVTEDVWLGMNMEEVKKKMNIDDSAFFEEGVVKFASFERDGYLYELSFVVNSNGDYLLGFSCISNAAKINSSSVKSFGERLKEGGLNAIYAQ